MTREVTRHIAEPVQRMLWGVAAGRCEFAGCNRPLWKSEVTQEQVNTAEKAHIYSFSADGPRGNDGIDDNDLNSLSNLMLVCHACHRKMDQSSDGGRYTIALLRKMKREHESRIETVTAIAPDRSSHIVLYGANISQHGSPLCYSATAPALFPDRYPAEAQPIQLGVTDSVGRDLDDNFWKTEEQNLSRKFDQRVRERLADGMIRRLSVFALAPQPLLILLGSLLTDIPEVDVFQLQREPKGWDWPRKRMGLELIVDEPKEITGPPALVLALSATISPERVTSVMNDGCTIWQVTIAEPHNDLLKARGQLVVFRRHMRLLMDRIKAVHGQDATLHVFPAAPVATAVELGRIRMAKADLPWLIYDQNNERGGFVPTLTVS